MSQQLSQDQVIDLSMNIIKDSKRRQLYWNTKEKKGYQINNKDSKWIRLYELSLVFCILIYTIFQMFTSSLISFIFAMIGYGVVQLGFRKFFFKDKIPFKVKESDIELFNHPLVLKQKRSLETYKLLFVLLLGALEVSKLYNQSLSDPIVLLTIAVVITLIVFRIKGFLMAYRNAKAAK